MTPNQQKSAFVQKTAQVFLAGLFLGITITAQAADEVSDFIEKARAHLESKSDQAHVVLKIIEASGEQKRREMNLRWLRLPDGFKAIVRMTTPADVKGTAMLSEAEKGEHQEWLYLPSTKQIRRIASSSKSAGILGSEVSAEDLDPVGFKDSTAKVLKNDPQVPALELTPKPGSSVYSKVVTTFSLPNYLPQKTDYYKNNTLEKTVSYQDYKMFEGGIYRAQKIHVLNVVKNRATDLDLTDIKVNPALSAKDFSPNALKESW